ncbi:hypothetical protein GY45DRAFT_1434710, partial [Cubamyces sp. BRFM 1775]
MPRSSRKSRDSSKSSAEGDLRTRHSLPQRFRQWRSALVKDGKIPDKETYQALFRAIQCDSTCDWYTLHEHSNWLTNKRRKLEKERSLTATSCLTEDGLGDVSCPAADPDDTPSTSTPSSTRVPESQHCQREPDASFEPVPQPVTTSSSSAEQPEAPPPTCTQIYWYHYGEAYYVY